MANLYDGENATRLLVDRRSLKLPTHLVSGRPFRTITFIVRAVDFTNLTLDLDRSRFAFANLARDINRLRFVFDYTRPDFYIAERVRIYLSSFCPQKPGGKIPCKPRIWRTGPPVRNQTKHSYRLSIV